MEVSFSPQFIRKFKKLPHSLQEEALSKIELFKNGTNSELLLIHKLKGRLEGRMSFSVNYKFRIIFKWEQKNESAILISIGDHSVYE